MEKIHNHPMAEQRENIPKDKVLVDVRFKEKFSKSFPYWDSNHIIVLRCEYEKLINEKKP